MWIWLYSGGINIRIKNRIDLLNIAVREFNIFKGLIINSDAIEGLFILTPTDSTDETLIVISNSLSSDLYRGTKPRVIKPKLI